MDVLVKESQRASLSCTECARRKTRCSKEYPCTACTRRGKAHLCRATQHVKSSEATSTPPAPPDSLDLLAISAFREVEDVRTTIDGLRSKVAGLESLLVSAFTKLKEQRDAGLGTSMPTIPPEFAGLASSSWSASKAEAGSSRDILVAGTSGPSYSLDANGSTSDNAFAQEEHKSIDGMDSGSNGVAAGQADDLREEEVAASLSLEYMALGRQRAPSLSEQHHVPAYLGDTSSSRSSTLLYDPTSLPPNPITTFPTIASVAGVIPPFTEAQIILRHAVEWIGWYHGCVHGPTFLEEVAEFWSLGDNRVELVNPAWLAVFFAQMAAGVRHMVPQQLAALGTYGLSEDEAKTLTKTHQDAALACLHHANFLENHSLFAVQAIALLVITGQDGGVSQIFPALLNVGISIAQALGMHRLPSAEQWTSSVASAPLDARVRSLVAYELKKRVFWALTAQAWFLIPLQRTTPVQPTQITTPLPCNARDEDMLKGNITDRPPSEYTVISNTLIWIQFAKILQQVFAHLDENPSPSYAYVLKLDAQMQEAILNVPAWMREGGPTEGMPSCVHWVRNTFAISSAHKVLTLQRPFLARAFRDRRYETSRLRALAASRTILREGAKCGDNRLWTVPYHISAAASVVCLDLFQQGSPTLTLDEERLEVQHALRTLRAMESSSPIASRGVALVTNLLAEESRLHNSTFPPPVVTPSSTHRKRKHDNSAPHQSSSSRGFTSAANKLTLPGSTLSSILASPSRTSLLTLAGSPPSSFHFATTGPNFSPQAGSTPSDTGGSSLLDPFGNFVTEAELPPEFLSVFLGQGFDPLELLNSTGATSPWTTTAEAPF